MNAIHHTSKELIILKAIPSFPNDRNQLPREVILLAAYDFMDMFTASVRAFQESNRDARYKPCMSQAKYADDIYKMLCAHHNRPIAQEKNNIYQVLFAACCLMNTNDHKRSWWEETFAVSTAEYLEKTIFFQGAKAQIQAVSRRIIATQQYELDFASTNHAQTAVQQTLQLFAEVEEVEHIKQQKTKSKAPKRRSNHLHVHIHGSVNLGDNIQTLINFNYD